MARIRSSDRTRIRENEQTLNNAKKKEKNSPLPIGAASELRSEEENLKFDMKFKRRDGNSRSFEGNDDEIKSKHPFANKREDA